MNNTSIPNGNCRGDVYIRRAIIVECLSPFIGKSFLCKALNDKEVEILYNSVDETVIRASQRYESTLAAIRLIQALRESTLARTDLPKSKQKKKCILQKYMSLKLH